MEDDIIESCLNCINNERLKYTGEFCPNGNKFCPHYPDKMSILNPDIIGGYVCDKFKLSNHDNTSIKNFGKHNPFPNIKDGVIEIVGVFPINDQKEFTKQLKEYLKKLGFFKN